LSERLSPLDGLKGFWDSAASLGLMNAFGLPRTVDPVADVSTNVECDANPVVHQGSIWLTIVLADWGTPPSATNKETLGPRRRSSRACGDQYRPLFAHAPGTSNLTGSFKPYWPCEYESAIQRRALSRFRHPRHELFGLIAPSARCFDDLGPLGDLGMHVGLKLRRRRCTRLHA